MASSRKVTWDDDKLVKVLKGIPVKMGAFIYASCRYHSTRAQTYARQNAPWKDRTSNARNGLFAKTVKGKDTYAIVVFGTVTYQPFLEVRWSGRYAIIRPTVQNEGPELMKTLSKGFAVIFGGN